jgi:probable HAF family extracellular repeat protein
MKQPFTRRFVGLLLVAGFLAVGGCGDDNDESIPSATLTPTLTLTPTPSPTPQATAFLIPLLPDAPIRRQVNFASAVSADGTVVVGLSASDAGDQAFRWTVDGELQALGMLPGYTASSQAYAVSGDGSVVVGESLRDDGTSRAFAWTAESGMQPLGDLPFWVTSSEAFGISADGLTVVGVAQGHDPKYTGEKTLCFFWSAEEGFQLFGDFLSAEAVGTECRAFGISGNGQVVVGEARYDIAKLQPVMQGFRFTRDTGMLPLGFVDPETPESSALSASATGSAIGGSSNTIVDDLPIGSPMRWSTTVGPTWILYQGIGEARAVSADGTHMAGGAADAGTAFVWDVDNGYRNLYGLLVELGLDTGLEGYSPISVNGISADGHLIVGHALREGGVVRAFVVRLP